MSFHIWLFLILSALPVISFAECIGPKDSKIVAIYLHGMDTEPPSQQELLNRKILKKISKSLKIGIAIPRAKTQCPYNKDQFCWGWNFNESGVIDSTLKIAFETKEQCFPKSKTTGLVGFSNGGFVANQITKDCRATELKWLISIGAGDFQNKNDTKDLSKCSPLILMAGKKDKSNYEAIKELGKWLSKQKADVTIIEYKDSHSIPEKDLQKILKSIIPKKW